MQCMPPKIVLFIAMMALPIFCCGMENGSGPSAPLIPKKVIDHPCLGPGMAVTLTSGLLMLTMPHAALDHFEHCHKARPIFAACTRGEVITTAAHNARAFYAHTFSTFAFAARVDDSKQ